MFGAGYVGLVTGTCFADLGHEVVIRDVVPERIERLRAGEIPIYEPGLDKVLDRKLIELCRPALEEKKPVKLDLPIKNINRTTGAMLSGEVARRYGHAGLPEDTIAISLHGNAGQSFGAFLARGVSRTAIS